MSRLTGHNYEHDLFRDIYCKLQYLENIEEEIGIDFITLFKALKHGIYINDEDFDPPVEISVEDGTYDCKEIVVYDKDTKNEINTTIYEIAEVEVEND